MVFTLFFAQLVPRTLVAKESKRDTVEANMLVKFCKYIRWQKKTYEKTKNQVKIGTYKNPNMMKAIKAAVKKNKDKIGKRKVTFATSDDYKKLEDCHILILGDVDAEEMKAILKFFDEKPVLLVSRAKDFAKSGGILEFLLVGGKVRFKFNLKSSKKSKIKINANLLKLAIEVFK